MLFVNFWKLKTKKRERMREGGKRENGGTICRMQNCRKRVSWGSDAFLWSSYSGGSSYVLPI